MMKNFKSKKIFALVTVVFFMVSFLPIVQASDAVYKANKNAMPVALTTDELLAKYTLNLTMADIAPINDDVKLYVETRAIPDNIPEMTKEDEYRLACFPGYFTPEQATIQDTIYNNGYNSRVNPQPVKMIVIIDEEAYAYYASNNANPTWAGCCAWANNIIEGGDDMMEMWFGIDFQTQSAYFELWNSPNYMDGYQLWSVMQTTNPSLVGCDVTILLTAQPLSNSVWITTMGLAGGHSIVMDVTSSGWPNYHPLANLFQHEASHLFGCPDHDPGLTDYCIMSYTWDSVTRDYCKTGVNCFNITMTNRCRFD